MKRTVAAKPIHDRLTADQNGVFGRNAFQMIVAKDGYELVTLCRTQPIDLALVPFSFGQFSGAAICKSLKSLPLPPMTLLFCDDMQQAKANAAVANDVVVGDVEPGDMLNRLAKLLGVSLREDVRVLVRLRVEASLSTHPHLILGTIVDISVSGMLVETASQVATGDVLSAEFYLPGQTKALAMMCKVVRLDERDPTARRVGLQFLRGPEDVTQRIKHFIQVRNR